MTNPKKAAEIKALENAPFHILGYDHDNFYFLQHGSHEIIIFSGYGEELAKKKNLLKIYPALPMLIFGNSSPKPH